MDVDAAVNPGLGGQVTPGSCRPRSSGGLQTPPSLLAYWYVIGENPAWTRLLGWTTVANQVRRVGGQDW